MLKSKPIILTVIVVTFLLAFAFTLETPHTQKVDAKPTLTDCTSGCYAWFAWDGTTYGGAGVMEMAGSGMALHNSTAYFQRWAGFWGLTQEADGHGAIHIGEEVDQPYSGVCNRYWPYKAQYYYIQAWDVNNESISRTCVAMDNANVNKYSNIQLAPYVSNGGGMQAQIWGWDGQHVVDSIPYSSGALHSWSSMGMQEEIFDKIQGYEVWGAYNTGWQWLNGNGSYIYQDRNQDILSKENPPQMYWLSGYTPPQYPGGLGITCDYDGGTSCTHGS